MWQLSALLPSPEGKYSKQSSEVCGGVGWGPGGGARAGGRGGVGVAWEGQVAIVSAVAFTQRSGLKAKLEAGVCGRAGRGGGGGGGACGGT